MSTDTLTADARRENALMLAAALGSSLADAAKALDIGVVITSDSADEAATLIAGELLAILGRTVFLASTETIGGAAVEVVVGAAAPRTQAPVVFISVSSRMASIGTAAEQRPCDAVPGVFAVLVACYAAAVTMRVALGEQLPFDVPSPLTVNFNELGIQPEQLAAPLDIGRTHLAGAGAIGNAFLWAARHLNLQGELHIVDDDCVSSGNLNRQIWFSQSDIGLPKADRLTTHARPHFPRLVFVPHRCRLQEVTERSEGPWLRRLIVAVDSRRARRMLQNEFPGEVFDASTTDIREVVIHHHRQVTANACLSCIYEPDIEEQSREQHIAEHLGVSVQEVREERISQASAQRIIEKLPSLVGRDLVGIAYDTLFKELCGSGELQTVEGKRILAPFAFVSVLAGTLLVIELVRQLTSEEPLQDNYWRASPWHPPIGRRRMIRPRQPGCSFCGNPTFRSINETLWS